MAIARDTTVDNIKPLESALAARYTPGAAIAVGELVSMEADGNVDPANTTSAAIVVVGMALQAASAASTPGKIDVVVHGRVEAVTGGTAGATLHATDTAGEPGESAGSNAGIAGFVESATVVFIRPTH